MQPGEYLPVVPQVALTLHSPEKLLRALYWIWDAFDRANVPWFLVHQTAKDAMKDHDLTGDSVEVGIKKTEWVSGGRRLLDAFLGYPLFEDDTQAQYDYEGVKVIIHVYEPTECIQALDMKRYRNEEFYLPNPYSQFEEIYG